MGVTSQRPSTPAQPPPHCNFTALRVVTGVGQGFPVVGFFQVVGQVGRSVAQSVEVTPKRSKERGGRGQRLHGQGPKTSQRLERQSLKKSSRLGQPKAVGRVKASGNLCTKSSRPGLPSAAGRVKASPVGLACLIQQNRTSEVFWSSHAAHLTQWAMQKWLVHASPGDCRPEDACCTRGRFSTHRVARP